MGEQRGRYRPTPAASVQRALGRRGARTSVAKMRLHRSADYVAVPGGQNRVVPTPDISSVCRCDGYRPYLSAPVAVKEVNSMPSADDVGYGPDADTARALKGIRVVELTASTRRMSDCCDWRARVLTSSLSSAGFTTFRDCRLTLDLQSLCGHVAVGRLYADAARQHAYAAMTICGKEPTGRVKEPPPMTIEPRGQIAMVGARTSASATIAGPQQVSTLQVPHRAQMDVIALAAEIGGGSHVDAHH